MPKNESSKLVKMLLDEAEARNAFMADPKKFVADNKLDLSDDDVQSLTSISHEALDDLKKGIDFKTDKLNIRASGDSDVEVLCACGSGYFPK
jgi:hypothetical protein